MTGNCDIVLFVTCRQQNPWWAAVPGCAGVQSKKKQRVCVVRIRLTVCDFISLWQMLGVGWCPRFRSVSAYRQTPTQLQAGQHHTQSKQGLTNQERTKREIKSRPSAGKHHAKHASRAPNTPTLIHSRSINHEPRAVTAAAAPLAAPSAPLPLNGAPHVRHLVAFILALQNMDRHTEQMYPVSMICLWQKQEAR